MNQKGKWLTQLFEKKKTKTQPEGQEKQRAAVLVSDSLAGTPDSAGTTAESIADSPVDLPAEPERIEAEAVLPSVRAAENEAARIIYQSDQGTAETKRQVIALLRSLIDRTVADAELAAVRFKAKAREEAEDEAARIIERARQTAVEIRRRVETVNVKDAEDLLSIFGNASRDTAEEARQRLQAYLIKMRAEIEKEVRKEQKRNWFRVFSSLVSKIRKALPQRAVSYPSAALGTSQRSAISPSLFSKIRRSLPPGKPAQQAIENVAGKQAAETEPPEPTPASQDALPLFSRQETGWEVKQAGSAQETLEKPVLPGAKAESQTTRPPVEEMPKPRVTDKEPARQEPGGVTLKLDTKTIYEGEIELAIAAPVDVAAVTKLFNYLQTTPDMKILYTRGSWDRGTVITVTLDKPLPFFDMISRIPGLAITPALSQKELVKTPAGSLLGANRKAATRVVLGLKLA